MVLALFLAQINKMHESFDSVVSLFLRKQAQLKLSHGYIPDQLCYTDIQPQWPSHRLMGETTCTNEPVIIQPLEWLMWASPLEGSAEVLLKARLKIYEAESTPIRD